MRNPGSQNMLRSALGYWLKGPNVAWVKLPPYMNSTGFKVKLGYGRLYFGWHDAPYPEIFLGVPINSEATRLLRASHTEFVGRSSSFDQSRHLVYGYAWLVPDEGYRCPVFRVGEDHKVEDVRAWLLEEYGDDFAVHSDRSGDWVVQTISDTAAFEGHNWWLDDLRQNHPAKYAALDEFDKQPPNMRPRLAYCKMRWG
jgi:hypothetical protein